MLIRWKMRNFAAPNKRKAKMNRKDLTQGSILGNIMTFSLPKFV